MLVPGSVMKTQSKGKCGRRIFFATIKATFPFEYRWKNNEDHHHNFSITSRQRLLVTFRYHFPPFILHPLSHHRIGVQVDISSNRFYPHLNADQTTSCGRKMLTTSPASNTGLAQVEVETSSAESCEKRSIPPLSAMHLIPD